MRQWQRRIIKTPILGHAILFVVRAKTATRYFLRTLSNLVKWLFKSNEVTNYTYDLERNNTHYLASLIAVVTNIEFDVAMSYIKELEEDRELRNHIANATAKSDSSFMADKTVRYGRRIGWYVFARALKPRTIVGTGVDKGLGACVVAAALKKNKEDGYDGRYYGTDINPNAGYLLSGDYVNYGRILFGDSIESLEAFDGMIDLFINDSDHSAAYEAEEYRTIENNLSKNAILLGDNSHCTDKLLEFSLRTNRQFVFFQEKPHEHWHPGGGIGISFKI